MNKKFDVVKRDVKLFGRLRKDGTPTKRSQLMIYVNESGQYLLYADYAHMGLAKSRTRYSAFLDPKSDGRQEKMGRAYTHTYLVWTERGRKFIHDLAHRYWELCEVYS